MRPVHAKAQVTTGQRAFDDDEVGQAVQARGLAQKQLQGTNGRHDDAQLGIAKARVVGHQRKRAQMQTRAERDPIYPGVQRGVQPHLQRLFGPVHGQLFHAVDKHHAGAFFGLHGLTHMQLGRFGQTAQIELHLALVRVVDVVFVQLGLFLDKAGVKAAVGDVLHHGIGNMAYATQPRCFQGQFGGGDVHAHTANDDWHQFLFAKTQPKIIKSFHCHPVRGR